MPQMRLNKFLADAGMCSRRKADEHIAAGEVYVNGERAAVGMKIDPQQDEVFFRGQRVAPQSEQLVYYALYKPRGVVSTASDEKGRPTVTDLVPPTPRVYPVGRLDFNSEGLMLLTNDGDLAHRLMHPSFGHEREYELVVRREDDGLDWPEVPTRLTRGLEVDGQLMRADRVAIKPVGKGERRAALRLVLHTGLNRQVRRMCEALGLTVVRLQRTRLGKLSLDSLHLKPGDYRQIERSDVL